MAEVPSFIMTTTHRPVSVVLYCGLVITSVEGVVTVGPVGRLSITSRVTAQRALLTRGGEMSEAAAKQDGSCGGATVGQLAAL